MLDRAETADQLARLLGTWRNLRPSYRGLAEGIRLLVRDGRLPPGTRMPSERELARALEASRTTVAAAYALLRESGFLSSRPGAASRITVPRRAGTPATARPRTAGGETGAISPVEGDGREEVLDLAIAAMSGPPGIARAVSAAADALPAYLGGHGYHPRGLPALREALAARYAARGLPTTADQIIVAGGALQALTLALDAFVSPGDRVLVEHPTYPNSLEAVRRASARPVPVPVGERGWDLPMFEATLRQAAPRVAYLVADFHNPTGLLMDAAARERVAGLLARTRTPAVVDETLVDLGLDVADDAMPPSVATFDRRDGIVLLGSASKSFWGGLGVGWIRAPSDLVPNLLAARAATDHGTGMLGQLAVTELLAVRDVVLAERKETLRTQRGALVDALRRHLPQWRFTVPPGGLGLWCELDAPVSSALAAVAEHQGVRLAAGPRFGTGGAFERYVRLPFTLPPALLTEAVERIAAAYDVVTSQRPTGELTVVA